MCHLALRLAEKAMGRGIASWPPPRDDRAAILEALRRVRDMDVRYILEPDPRGRIRFEWYAQAVLDLEYNGSRWKPTNHG